MAVRASSLFAYELVYALIQMSVLVIILVYDMRHKIIPNVFAYTFALIAFVHMFFGASAHGGLGFVVPALSTIGAGPLLAFPFYLVWLLSRGKWMGLGDAKLALGMGWFLGLTAGASAIMLAFWVGAVVSIAILLLAELLKGARTHNFLGLKFRLSVLNMKSEIPFAPFLIIGLLIVYFFSYNIVAHLSLF
jgi:prepilin signal peptidase PulO-like enzyme (type II secretory pathway)